MPSEFAPLVSAHQSAQKLSVPLKATMSSADQEYEKQTDPATPVPSAPVYAARLNGLLNTLAHAESAVADCVKAREGLVSGLEKLLESNRAALDADRENATRLATRKQEIEEKKQQVEMAIMQALGSSSENNNGSSAQGASAGTEAPEPDRPEMEALTPPSVVDEPVELPESGQEFQQPNPEREAETEKSSYHTMTVTSNGSNKRRRVDGDEGFPDLAGDELDADVDALIKDSSTA